MNRRYYIGKQSRYTELIDHMRGKDNGKIAIWDEDLESGLYKKAI